MGFTSVEFADAGSVRGNSQVPVQLNFNPLDDVNGPGEYVHTFGGTLEWRVFAVSMLVARGELCIRFGWRCVSTWFGGTFEVGCLQFPCWWSVVKERRNRFRSGFGLVGWRCAAIDDDDGDDERLTVARCMC